jgi:hypothetical protein
MTALHQIPIFQMTNVNKLLAANRGHASRYSTVNTVLAVVGTFILIAIVVLAAAAMIKRQSKGRSDDGPDDRLQE